MRRSGIDHSRGSDYSYHMLYWHASDLRGKNGCRPLHLTRGLAPAAALPRGALRRRMRGGVLVMDDQTTRNRGRMTARRRSRAPQQAARMPAGGSHHAASIGRVARRIRDELGLTLASVAQQAHISPGMLSRLETGRVSPSLDTIVALAEVLGIRPALLLQDIGSPEEAAQHNPAGQGLEVERGGPR